MRLETSHDICQKLQHRIATMKRDGHSEKYIEEVMQSTYRLFNVVLNEMLKMSDIKENCKNGHK